MKNETNGIKQADVPADTAETGAGGKNGIAVAVSQSANSGKRRRVNPGLAYKPGDEFIWMPGEFSARDGKWPEKDRSALAGEGVVQAMRHAQTKLKEVAALLQKYMGKSMRDETEGPIVGLGAFGFPGSRFRVAGWAREMLSTAVDILHALEMAEGIKGKWKCGRPSFIEDFRKYLQKSSIWT